MITKFPGERKRVRCFGEVCGWRWERLGNHRTGEMKGLWRSDGRGGWAWGNIGNHNIKWIRKMERSGEWSVSGDVGS